MLASQLAPMLKESDVLWIHDYHLIPFAQELRALGCKQRMGFFNHIPLPPPDVIKQIPQHRQLMEALMSYDLVGMQSPTGVENLRLYAETEGVGQQLANHDLSAFGKKASIQAFPIGIDVESLKALVPSPSSQTILDEVRNESGKRMLMVGVDRLDYSKGVPRRLKAFRELLETLPELQNKITLVQIAAPTRQSVPAYARLSDKTKKLVNEINDQFGTDDWKPVMYFNQSVDRNSLPEIYRMSHVGVVTPVADGMNLVAKEYIAAQKSEDPGVLVLSTGAGAASQLRESLLVPPKDRATMAKAYARALAMPLDERQKRHAKLMANVETEDLRWWRENYLSELASPQAAPNAHPDNMAPESTSGPDDDRNDSVLSQFAKSTLKSARSVYEDSRLYHGTGKTSKRSIQAKGFTSRLKVDGGAMAVRTNHKAQFENTKAPSYHYLTAEKGRASKYASSEKSRSPALVRTIGIRQDIPLERVMGVERTSADIPAQYVVGSKSSIPGPESAAFHKALESASIHVPFENTGRLLREVQSDSEDDFSSDEDSA
ncbi:alpha,alpha-trehalose-phosphate synthase (UDP-forming) [Ralstonia sp. A12]|uniref:alpha,alpha-trehalose-phosphate synthase (UDP-forming) n=1 Tax=Ralstonia sp. A12 TaxID=1217052 RepID=UPI000B237146|nr:trehalose-6-phosphate synthase [Ralstonia sp. A12]